jgi:hypothetical protein
VKRISRLLIAFGLVAISMPFFISSASAVSTTYTGLGEGQLVYGTDGVYEQAMVQNTNAGPTYCISVNTPIYPGDLLNEASFAEAIAAAPGGELTLSGLQKIVRIVKNLYPNDNPDFPIAGDINQKAASVQSAVWSFSNNWDLNTADSRNDATVIANYNLIRGWVDGDSANGELPAFVSEPEASISVDPESATAETNEKAGPFTVKIQDGTSKVKVTVTGGIAVDSSGVALDPNYEYGNHEQFYITKTTAGSATAEIAGSVNSAPGRPFIPIIKGHQLLIGLLPFEGESVVSATATFTDPEIDPEDPGVVTTDPEVQGTSVTRPTSGVQVKGTSVSAGTLANTGVNGISLAFLSMGVAMLVLGLTLTSFRKLGEIHAV